MTIPTTTLAGKQVGRMGFGLMQLTWNPEPPSEEESFAAMKAAADAGATAWSTATFYGNPGDPMANIKLLRKFFDKYPEYKEKIVLVVKGGLDPKIMQPTTDMDSLRKEAQETQTLLGDKFIDVYSYARLPVGEDVEETMKRLVTLQKEGLIGAIGASEMKAETLERAQKITPISILEIEVSLWSYETEIRDAVAWSKKHSVPIFAYSPLGRGFLTRKWKSPEDIPEGSFQRRCPRFQGDNFYKNLELVDRLDEISAKRGVTTAQLALGWLLSLSDQIIPIPGSSNPKRAQENIDSANLKFSEEDLASINEFLEKFPASGGRYDDHHQAMLMQ